MKTDESEPIVIGLLGSVTAHTSPVELWGARRLMLCRKLSYSGFNPVISRLDHQGDT